LEAAVWAVCGVGDFEFFVKALVFWGDFEGLRAVFAVGELHYLDFRLMYYFDFRFSARFMGS
jgi:hypothetical protein